MDVWLKEYTLITFRMLLFKTGRKDRSDGDPESAIGMRSVTLRSANTGMRRLWSMH